MHGESRNASAPMLSGALHRVAIYRARMTLRPLSFVSLLAATLMVSLTSFICASLSA
jgi:hypothetical protein